MASNCWIAIAAALVIVGGLTPTASAATVDVSPTDELPDQLAGPGFPCDDDGPLAPVCLVLGLVGDVCRDVTGEACFY